MTSGNPEHVGATSTGVGVPGIYEVKVTELARAQVTASTTTYASPDEVDRHRWQPGHRADWIPTGQHSPNGVAGTMTVRQLADAINADTNSPVSASVVQAAPGEYRLVLTGRNWSANAFTVTSSLSGGTGVTFGASAVAASNASLTVNNIPITSTTNSVDDAIPGVSLSLMKKDPDTTVVVGVTESADEAQKQLDEFVKVYNDLMSFVTEQGTAALAGKTNISRDSLVRTLKMGLTDAMRTEYLGSNTDYTRLSTIGVEFELTGTIKVDAAKLKPASLDNASAVRTLFVGTTGTGGVSGALKAQVEGYTTAGGFVQDAKDRLKDQILRMTAGSTRWRCSWNCAEWLSSVSSSPPTSS